MKVKELIELLQDMPQDLEVYSLCDHGQSPGQSAPPTIAYSIENTYCLWDEWTSYKEDAEDRGYTQEFVLL